MATRDVLLSVSSLSGRRAELTLPTPVVTVEVLGRPVVSLLASPEAELSLLASTEAV